VSDAVGQRAPTTTTARVVLFGSRAGEGALALAGAHRQKGMLGVLNTAGAIDALVLDARSPRDLFRANELLRALYDDPRAPTSVLSPSRVLAVIQDGDTEAAFALGRFGVAGIIEDRASAGLCQRVARIARERDAQPLAVPSIFAPARSTRLAPRGPTDLPTVTVGYRHADETLEALARYVRVLERDAHACSVFADVATLLRVMVEEGLTCQTNLAAKAGATHTGQFIGSFAFYRELRRTRYGRIADHPSDAIEMDVFIAVDEILHEVLHLLYLANHLRAGIVPKSTLFAEELSLTWWQGVVHNRVWPEWLSGPEILEINDDFLLDEANAKTRGFWTVGTVFSRYASYPWVPWVLRLLPERASYIGERADLIEVIARYASRPEAAFLVLGAETRLTIPVDFGPLPEVPTTLRLGPRSS
jgi:hypothetical protein